MFIGSNQSIGRRTNGTFSRFFFYSFKKTFGLPNSIKRLIKTQSDISTILNRGIRHEIA